MLSTLYVIFTFLSIFCALSDFVYYRIPNLLILIIFILFIIRVVFVPESIDLYFSAFIFIITLSSGYLLNTFKVMGAGDAKFLSTSVLWVIPVDGIAYLLYISFAGGILALVYSLLPDPIDQLRLKMADCLKSRSAFIKQILGVNRYIDLSFTPARTAGWKTTVLPYGVAIGAANSVIMYFYLFS